MTTFILKSKLFSFGKPAGELILKVVPGSGAVCSGLTVSVMLRREHPPPRGCGLRAGRAGGCDVRKKSFVNIHINVIVIVACGFVR